MSAAPALPMRDADSTFGPNIEAELSKVVDVPDALPRLPCVQHFTDDWCATCRRSNEVACGTLQLHIATQLLPGNIEAATFQVLPVACVWCARPYAPHITHLPWSAMSAQAHG